MIVQDSIEHIAWRETFWQGRERVFLERFETELALARDAYRRGMADVEHAENEMREALMRAEQNGASKATIRKTRAEHEHEIAECRDAMREAEQRGVWLWECRLAIWLGGLLKTVYAGMGEAV